MLTVRPPTGEGGVRANALVNGGLLPPAVRGSKLAGVHSYIHLCDFWATFLGLAGVDASDPKAAQAKLPPPDSLDMWPMLSGRNLTSPRTEILGSPLKGVWQPLLAGADGEQPAAAGALRREDFLDAFDRERPGTTDECDPSGKRSQTHYNGKDGDPFGDLRDPMLIQGRWKLLLGLVDQCWWQGPQYPNGSSTWDTHATEINCTTGCLFDIIAVCARSPCPPPPPPHTLAIRRF
jgi:hypothetical protein